MRCTFSPADVAPHRSAVFEHLRMPPEAADPRVDRLYDDAAALLDQTAAPVGLLATVTATEFAVVYEGEGRNESKTPVADVFPRADHLALFATTLGPEASKAVQRCFESNDFALAAMLDAMASAAADRAAELMEGRWAEVLHSRGWAPPDGAVLRYSPGYCGWDVTGQQRLFARLAPASIGITLTDSCVMLPLKSVSGVLIGGPLEIHRFPTSYPACSRCETRECRDRLRVLMARHGDAA